MGMSAGGSSGLNNEPNLVPMIDVLLVLLVIFMLIVPMSRRVIDVQLPDPNPSQTPPSDVDQIVMEVLPDEQYRINTKEVSKAGLEQKLHEIFDLRPDKIMFIKGDPTVKYQEVIFAMDVSRGAGVKVIGIPPRDTKEAAKAAGG